MDDNKKFWDRMAKLYAPIQQKSNRQVFEAVTSHCRKYLTPATRVLEVACGSGQLTLPLYDLAGSWEATDFSEKMVSETRKRCPAEVRTAVQDATALTYKDESFDLVVMANALHIMPEPERALQEIRRVLTTEGVLLAPTFVFEGKPNRFRIWISDLVGFKTYHDWNLAALVVFLENAGFEVLEKALIPADPVPEAFLALKKK